MATAVSLSASSLTFSSLGETQQLVATVKDQKGQTMAGASVSWASSDSQVAGASSTGLVTALGNGTAAITAASGAVSAIASATIQQVAAALTISRDTLLFTSLADSVTLTAAVKDANNRTITDPVIEWATSDAALATVSAEGLVTVQDYGSVTITATSGPTSASAEVRVIRPFSSSEFVLVQPGTFSMGRQNGFPDEQPLHTVTLTKPFYLQKTEVTQGRWREVMGSNPSFFTSCGDDCPVEMVSWNDIQGFLAKLNSIFPDAGYRLPTETEWEYACRAGTTGNYGGTGVLDEMGWYWNNGEGKTHPVAQKLANAWGLYDMHGNTWEWVQDWKGPYPSGPVTDPTGIELGERRVLRGGAWSYADHGAMSSSRSDDVPARRTSSYGFRLVRER